MKDKKPWLKVIWVSLKVRSVHSNPEENFCLNVFVFLRSCFSVLKNPKTTDPFTEFSFAKGLAKVKLGGVC